MTVKYIGNTIKKFICLSTDTKPIVTSVPVGSELYEADTNIIYVNTGSEWTRQTDLNTYH